MLPETEKPIATGSQSLWRRLPSFLYGWPPATLDGSRETAWLDGLRGVAAFLVMTYHYHLEWWNFYLEAPYGALEGKQWQLWRLPFLRLLMCSGHAQVSVFFVLSGFVLSWSPLGSLHRGQQQKMMATLSSATFRRWLRLYLPCFIIGFWSWLEYESGIVDLPVDRAETTFGVLWDYFKACEKFGDLFYLDRSEVDFRHPYNATMWTIPHEFAGSLLVFVVVLSVARFQDYRRRTLVTLGVAGLAMLKARWTYWLFTTGIVLADYIRQSGGFVNLSQRTSRTATIVWTLIFIFALFLAGIPERTSWYSRPGYEWIANMVPPNWAEIEGGGRWWWCWAGILIVLSASHLRWIRRFFEMSVMRYLGRISYMLYITHRLVFECVGRLVKDEFSKILGERKFNEQFGMYYYSLPPATMVLLFFLVWAITGPVAIFIAHWCEVFIDAPSVRLAKWLDDKFVNGFADPRTPDDEETVRQYSDRTGDVQNRVARAGAVALDQEEVVHLISANGYRGEGRSTEA